MGSQLSNDQLLNNVNKTIDELIDDYNPWANDKLCDNFELVYNDKLIKLSTVQLKGLVSTIGYTDIEKLEKKDLCLMIIGHYKKRIELLNKIKSAINKCKSMLTRARSGNVCLNVTNYVDDFYLCKELSGIWIGKDEYQLMMNKLKNQNRLVGLTFWLEGLNKTYNNSLRKINSIITMIKKDINKSVDEIEFGVIEEHTNKTLEYMLLICEIYYLLVINYK